MDEFAIINTVVSLVTLALVGAALREVRFIKDNMSRRRVVKRRARRPSDQGGASL